MKYDYTKEDVDRGWAWYDKHAQHVLEICQDSSMRDEKEFQMSGSDIGKPELWKPQGWRWFMRTYERSLENAV